MGKEKRKLSLFKFYQRNIAILCENTGYNREVLQNIIVCPICFQAFKESDVQKKDNGNYLTLEHVPPKYLGGKTEVLTCYKCNNLFSEFDSELRYANLKPDSKVVNWRAKLIADDDRFGAITTFDFIKKEVKFILSNNSDLTKFDESFKGKNQFNFQVKDKTKAVSVNLLKMAYLLAFHKFGYGLIMQPQYNFIREQINKPYQTVLDNHGVVYLNSDDSLTEGVFLVKEPKELISLLVRFNIRNSDDTTVIYSVHLPSPGVDVIEFYKTLATIPKGTKYVVAEIEDADYWHDRDLTYAPIQELERLRLATSSAL